MDRDQRVALLKLIKKARDDAQLRVLFMEFTELASSLPPQQRPAEEGVRDVLLAFGPGRDLALKLGEYYYQRAWGHGAPDDPRRSSSA